MNEAKIELKWLRRSVRVVHGSERRSCTNALSSEWTLVVEVGISHFHHALPDSYFASRGMGCVWISHAVTWLLTRGQVMPMAGSQATT